MAFVAYAGDVLGTDACVEYTIIEGALALMPVLIRINSCTATTSLR